MGAGAPPTLDGWWKRDKTPRCVITMASIRAVRDRIRGHRSDEGNRSSLGGYDIYREWLR